MLKQKDIGTRYRRMSLRAEVVVLRQGELWDSEVVDISASGLLMRRPDDWEGSLGDEMSVELLLAEQKTIALFGKVVRYDRENVGLEFSHIPPESEVPLWTLLGAYADALDAERSAE
ncbi:MAG: PilZ domain-containing protein [Pseudomonadota bacterium]